MAETPHAIETFLHDPAATRHSPLFQWLREHREQMAAALAALDKPRWDVIARAIAADGVTDGTGKPPTGERVRRTWHKVLAADAQQAQPAPGRQPWPLSPSRPKTVA